jgi:predicted nucleotide-binding protein
MSRKSQILDLVRRLDDLPLRNEDLLKGFLVDLKLTLKDFFGPGNQYLDYLKFVKFRPEAVFVTERELQRSWLAGRAQIANLLRVILNDPTVRDSEANPGEAASEEELSIRRFTDIQDSILGVLDDFQKEVLNRPAIEEDEGPLKDPLRKDFFEKVPPAVRPVPQESQPVSELQRRILVVPGSDQLVNDEVLAFLSSVSAEIVKKDDDRRRGESLLDHLNRCGAMDFAVVILAADFFFYPRTQKPDSARLMAAQEIVFQMGYLVAKLGRERVVILYQESDHFRRPTDYFDIYYVPVTSNAVWKTDLAKRLKACGIAAPSESRLTSMEGSADPV